MARGRRPGTERSPSMEEVCSGEVRVAGRNASPKEEIVAGDPLSPFLFVLVVEVLHRIIGEAVRHGRISLLLVGKDNIELSHLQFTDDRILFCPPEEETICNYKRLLRCFEMMTGLSINFDKFSLIPVNCEREWSQRMCILLGCKEATLPVKYLDISSGANPKLVKTWKPIIDKVEENLICGKPKRLIKLMPRAVADKLISLQRRFLWSNEDGRDGVPLVRWDIVQAPKRFEGLGVGDSVLRNTALLFKWWWWFLKKDCPLWKKIVCSCNDLKPNVLLSCQLIPNTKGPWRDICQLQIREQQARDKMVRGLSLELEDGRRIHFWEDKWLPCGVLQDVFPRLFSVSNQVRSIIGDCGFWDGLEWIWNFHWRMAETLPEVITSYSFTRSIWRGLVPPIVELFTWCGVFGYTLIINVGLLQEPLSNTLRVGQELLWHPPFSSSHQGKCSTAREACNQCDQGQGLRAPSPVNPTCPDPDNRTLAPSVGIPA
ncbi:uncharacterized protein LOC127741277 [Arachis duranensis]|uniref:Uncharacterized protein LOC127741277 n=1 Tax=Arachis duranensis TaxID=130453 RepID=A0A9C6WPD3_ARADU|nr:uncharacterized protein LOC127741277 [Arachis duranensis]